MIKAENLRIGDLVRVSAKCAFDKGTICTVVAVSNVFYCKKQRGIVKLRPINSYEMPQGVGSCDIEGIPLTSAFLEKNGFNIKDSEDFSKSYIKDIDKISKHLGRYFDIEYKNGVWLVFLRVKLLPDPVLVRQIQYVHELQHILCAIGIDAALEI